MCMLTHHVSSIFVPQNFMATSDRKPSCVSSATAKQRTSLSYCLSVQDNEVEAEEESSSEGAALEAAAALAAVSALVEGLKAFLSPHLSAVLNLLFSPPVLACKQAGCRESAGSIRIQLAGVMPPRLLLAPLFAHFEGAVKVRSPLALCCSCRHSLGMFPVAFKQHWYARW